MDTPALRRDARDPRGGDTPWRSTLQTTTLTSPTATPNLCDLSHKIQTSQESCPPVPCPSLSPTCPACPCVPALPHPAQHPRSPGPLHPPPVPRVPRAPAVLPPVRHADSLAHGPRYAHPNSGGEAVSGHVRWVERRVRSDLRGMSRSIQKTRPALDRFSWTAQKDPSPQVNPGQGVSQKVMIMQAS
jgi:hypothetical protein